VEHLALAGVSDAEKARASIPPTINGRIISSRPLAYRVRTDSANEVVPSNGQKVRSIFTGRPPPTAIAKALGIGRASVYWVLEAAR
jgi:DNA invertase Pin-like site-specific DNA recombinase